MVGFAVTGLAWVAGIASMTIGILTVLGVGPVHAAIVQAVGPVTGAADLPTLLLSAVLHAAVFVAGMFAAILCVVLAKLSLAIGV